MLCFDEKIRDGVFKWRMLVGVWGFDLSEVGLNMGDDVGDGVRVGVEGFGFVDVRENMMN